MLENFSYAAFAPYEGTPFRVQYGDSGSLQVELFQVTDRRPPLRNDAGTEPAGSMESFTLLFRGPRRSPLPQGTYHFDHADLGQFLLFIVPVGMDGDVLEYEAVINHAPGPVEPTP